MTLLYDIFNSEASRAEEGEEVFPAAMVKTRLYRHKIFRILG
jgi:hypothetical protein